MTLHSQALRTRADNRQRSGTGVCRRPERIVIAVRERRETRAGTPTPRLHGLVHVRHLHRARHVPRERHLPALLARDERAVRPVAVAAVVHLRGGGTPHRASVVRGAASAAVFYPRLPRRLCLTCAGEGSGFRTRASMARRRRGPQYTPDSAVCSRCSALCVLPELVGPAGARGALLCAAAYGCSGLGGLEGRCGTVLGDADAESKARRRESVSPAW